MATGRYSDGAFTRKGEKKEIAPRVLFLPAYILTVFLFKKHIHYFKLGVKINKYKYNIFLKDFF